MKKLSLALAAVLSVAVLLGAVVPVNAASAEVTIEIKQTAMDNVSVTVPTSLPIVFNEDGTNTLPTNWTIENISTIAGIHLAQIDLDGSATGWKVLAGTEDTKTMSADTKSVQFSVGKSGNLKLVAPISGTTSAKGYVTFEPNDISIPSGKTQILSFDLERGAFTSTQASEKAFDMVLTFEFN